MKIAIGADHGGYDMKEVIMKHLGILGHDVDDVGCFSSESVDYPTFAKRVCEQVITGRFDRGILICGTGIGMSMAANRYKGIRAALCHDEYTARMSREHNDANVLCFGARVIGNGVAEALVTVWLETTFTGGRHQRRIDLFSK